MVSEKKGVKKDNITKQPVKSKTTDSKHDNFLRLAKPRVQKVLDSLRILGNCSNKSNYHYDDKEVEKMFNTIYDTLEATVNKFKAEVIQQEKFEF